MSDIMAALICRRLDMKRPGIRSILRNTGYLFANQAAVTLVATLSAVVIARILGPELYGTLVYGYSWYLTLISLTYLGLDVVLVREIGRDRTVAPRLAGETLAIRAAAAAVIALLSAAAATVIEPDPIARNLILILSIALLMRTICLWCSSVFIAFENARPILLLDLLFRPLELAAILVVLTLVCPRNVLAISLVHVACWSVQAAIGLATVVRRATPIEIRLRPSQAMHLLAAGLPGALYTITIIWFLQAPIVLFRQVAGTGDVLGYFALATQLLGYLMIVPYLAASTALPVLSRSASRGDGNIRSAAIAMLTVIPVCGAILGVAGVWLAPATIAVIFGADYMPAGMILGEAIWLLIPVSLATNLQQVVFSHGRSTLIGALSALLGIAVMAGLYEPLARHFSYHGALLATGLGMTVWALGLILSLMRAGVFSDPRSLAARQAD